MPDSLTVLLEAVKTCGGSETCPLPNPDFLEISARFTERKYVVRRELCQGMGTRMTSYVRPRGSWSAFLRAYSFKGNEREPIDSAKGD